MTKFERFKLACRAATSAEPAAKVQADYKGWRDALKSEGFKAKFPIVSELSDAELFEAAEILALGFGETEKQKVQDLLAFAAAVEGEAWRATFPELYEGGDEGPAGDTTPIPAP